MSTYDNLANPGLSQANPTSYIHFPVHYEKLVKQVKTNIRDQEI